MNRSFRARLFVLALVLGALALVAISTIQCRLPAPQPSEGGGGSADPRPAPDVKLDPVEGGQATSLSAYKGKVVLLTFFTTWCGFCNKEAPDLEALHKEYAEQGLAVLSVCMDSEDEGAVQSFVRMHGVTYPVFAKSEQGQAAFGVSGYPTSIVIDREGLQRRKIVGAAPREDFEKAIGPLLTGKGDAG